MAKKPCTTKLDQVQYTTFECIFLLHFFQFFCCFISLALTKWHNFGNSIQSWGWSHVLITINKRTICERKWIWKKTHFFVLNCQPVLVCIKLYNNERDMNIRLYFNCACMLIKNYRFGKQKQKNTHKMPSSFFSEIHFTHSGICSSVLRRRFNFFFFELMQIEICVKRITMPWN